MSGTELQTIRRLRSRQTVDRLCELRALQALARRMTQQQIARELRVSQSAISQKLRQAQDVPQVLEGFTGGTLTEIMQQYAAEELSQDRLVDQLVRWPYRSEQYTDGLDWNPGAKVEGTWAEVAEGLANYLIDDVVYERVQAIRHEHAP